MQIVLIHIGESLPPYFYDCAEQCRRFFGGEIYAVVPEKHTGDNAHKRIGMIPVAYESLVSDPIYQAFKKYCFLDGFWNVTAGRLFLLEVLARQRKLVDIIHIENDVLIYHNLENMGHVLNSYSLGRVLLTPVGKDFTTAAYLYSRSSSALGLLMGELLRYLKMGRQSLSKKLGANGINEMTLLSLISKKQHGLIRHLPVQPSGSGSQGINEFNSVFDPASIGQYLGGTQSDGPGWAETRHYIGDSILNGRVSFEWKIEGGVKKPWIISGGKKYRINNIHVHSKKLKQFM